MSTTCIKHIEDYWKMITHSSHEKLSENNFNDALVGYREAMYRAEVLNNNIPDCIRTKIPFVEIYVSSCQNMAHTYERMGEVEKAKEMLQRAITYLIYLVNHSEYQDLKTIQAELKAVSSRYIQLTEKNKNIQAKKEHLFYTLVQKLKENQFQIL